MRCALRWGLARPTSQKPYRSSECRSQSSRELPRWRLRLSTRSTGPASRALRTSGLRAAIEHHLEVLPEPTQALLRSAAAIGREFSFGLLLDLEERPRGQLLAQLSQASEAGIVHRVADRVGRYRFTHALIREALYVQTPSAERASLHGRIGLAREARGAAASDALVPELADQFVQAAPAHDAGCALTYTLRLAALARERLAYEEAAAQLDRACQLLDLGKPDPAQRMELLLQKGEMLAYATDVGQSRSALLEALAIARELGATDAWCAPRPCSPGRPSQVPSILCRLNC